MTSSTRRSSDSRNRRSRRVRIPLSLPPTVIGTPEMWCPSMISRAWPTVASGGRVIGSTMMPFSDRLTLSTSRVWSSIDMFLWMTPRPPSCARAMASSASVTVSIGAERIGRFSVILGVSRVADVDLPGQQLGVAGLEQDVVESDALIGDTVLHRGKASEPAGDDSGAGWGGGVPGAFPVTLDTSPPSSTTPTRSRPRSPPVVDRGESTRSRRGLRACLGFVRSGIGFVRRREICSQPYVLIADPSDGFVSRKHISRSLPA